jgi:hypothetical protein
MQSTRDYLSRVMSRLRSISRSRVEFCSGLVDLVVGVRHHRGGGHRLALAGEGFVGLVAEDIAEVGNRGVMSGTPLQ